MNAREIVERLHLIPLEGEGGMFVSTYTSVKEAEGASIGSAIFYLLHDDCFSHMHRLTGDEIWYWHYGAPVVLTLLHPDGTVSNTVLGMDLSAGQVPQQLVPAGTWMGACIEDPSGFDCALLSTSNHPGYSPGCYTHGDREQLLHLYPSARDKILRLTGFSKSF